MAGSRASCPSATSSRPAWTPSRRSGTCSRTTFADEPTARLGSCLPGQ
ncbi:hypothetical protein [Ornithinimicrobium kibberense]